MPSYLTHQPLGWACPVTLHHEVKAVYKKARTSRPWKQTKLSEKVAQIPMVCTPAIVSSLSQFESMASQELFFSWLTEGKKALGLVCRWFVMVCKHLKENSL